jgi:hypothetical protein
MVDDFIRIRLIPLKPGESASSQDHSAGDNDVAIVRAEIGAISIDSHNRGKEYEKMKNKRLADINQQDFNFSPFANVGLMLRYPDAEATDRMVVKKEEIMRLNVTAGDTILLELSRIESL